MPIVKWRPLLDPFEEMDRMFDEMSPRRAPMGFAPAIDIYRDKDNIIVEAPLVGVDPEKVDISIEDNVLTIKGKSEKKTEVDEKNYYRKEISAGSFYRSIALPDAVKGDQAEASYDDGILKITIPTAEEKKPKTIKIKAAKR